MSECVEFSDGANLNTQQLNVASEEYIPTDTETVQARWTGCHDVRYADATKMSLSVTLLSTLSPIQSTDYV